MEREVEPVALDFLFDPQADDGIGRSRCQDRATIADVARREDSERGAGMYYI